MSDGVSSTYKYIPDRYLRIDRFNNPIYYRIRCPKCTMWNDKRYIARWGGKGYTNTALDSDSKAIATRANGCRNCGSDYSVNGIKV